MRIVSLACSNTEIVCALGCEGFLVGVDDHSDHPAEVVSRLPRVGPDLEIDVARVEALEPDLVLATLTVPGHEKAVARLEERGLPFLAPEPTSLAEVYDSVREIAGHLGVPGRGEALAREDPAQYRPDVIYRNEEWRDLPAVKDRRVFCIPEAFLGRPGPRLLDGLREVGKVIEELSRAPISERAGPTAHALGKVL